MCRVPRDIAKLAYFPPMLMFIVGLLGIVLMLSSGLESVPNFVFAPVRTVLAGFL